MTHTGHLRPYEFLPDPRRNRLQDILARNLYLKGSMETSHDTLTVGNEQTTDVHELLRVKAVTVGTVTGGTVTVQVYADGVPLFEDAERPVSGGGVRNPSSIFHVPRGAVLTTTIEADSGVPAGTANIVIDTEPFILVPRTPELELKGKDRLFPSRRREAERFNDFGSFSRAVTTERLAGSIGSEGGRQQDSRPISPTYNPGGPRGPQPDGDGGGGGSGPPSYPGDPRGRR